MSSNGRFNCAALSFLLSDAGGPDLHRLCGRFVSATIPQPALLTPQKGITGEPHTALVWKSPLPGASLQRRRPHDVAFRPLSGFTNHCCDKETIFTSISNSRTTCNYLRLTGARFDDRSPGTRRDKLLTILAAPTWNATRAFRRMTPLAAG